MTWRLLASVLVVSDTKRHPVISHWIIGAMCRSSVRA